MQPEVCGMRVHLFIYLCVTYLSLDVTKKSIKDEDAVSEEEDSLVVKKEEKESAGDISQIPFLKCVKHSLFSY